MKQNWEDSWGKGCMYINDWSKPISPLFLPWLLTPMVDFATPPPRVISQATPMLGGVTVDEGR